jgi:flagellar motor switch protein FliN/FliY
MEQFCFQYWSSRMVVENVTGDLFPESEQEKLKQLENIEVKLVVEVGSAMLTVRDMLKLNVGSVIELDTQAGEHLNIRANGTLVLKGEVILIGASLGIRMTDVVSPDERNTDGR